MAGRKLKVFEARFGFYDSVVAAPSQAAALRAWGARQNLFATGEARPTEDKSAIEQALKHPETPLRRAVGSDAVFALEPTTLPKIPDTPVPRKAKAAKAKPSAPSKPPPDRSELDTAEAALKGLDAARKREEVELRKRRDRLDADAAEAQAVYVKARKAAQVTVAKARKAYRADSER